jgi:hypothetical protein
MALGEIDAPFFGSPKKKRERKGGESAPFFAVLSAGRGGRMWSLSTSLSS